jgi:hypothetical protein
VFVGFYANAKHRFSERKPPGPDPSVVRNLSTKASQQKPSFAYKSEGKLPRTTSDHAGPIRLRVFDLQEGSELPIPRSLQARSDISRQT